jgi:hypothetical protein
MTHRFAFIAFGIVAVGSPALAQPETPPVAAAPSAGPDARYCLRVDPIIGSNLATIQCRTRADWESLDVDVDHEWADNGVRVIDGAGPNA